MNTFVIALQDMDRTQLYSVGGKGANLGELARIKDIRVPDGFCVTTTAFKKILDATPLIGEQLGRLSLLKPEERGAIARLSTQIREAIEETALPEAVREEILRQLSLFGEDCAWAVRSSATAEDLPGASFAGQQDTYLNIIGQEAVLQHIRRCWASLFSERAVVYRMQNGFDHRSVYLAVVVQQMVFPQAAGILFTADPLSSSRKVSSIDAGFGLGEALVSGLVNADNYQVREGRIIGQKIAAKKLAVYAVKEGGTREQEIVPAQQQQPVLTEEQILLLEQTGRKIEAHFGAPQDIEWCWADGLLYIVQSRPITTLYPVPEGQDGEKHVYISVGHQQMMTDAMKPLGLSLWQLTTARPMAEAGGRLFVDVTQDLASPARRHVLINVLGKSDPLLQDALRTLVERDFIPLAPADAPQPVPGGGGKGAPLVDFQALNDYDPSIVAELVHSRRESLAALKRRIHALSGTALIDFVLEDTQETKKILADPQSLGVIITGMNASAWINEKMDEWLGEKNAADTLSQSVPNNITSEMGRALSEVADTIRRYPAVIDCLEHAQDDHFLEELPQLEGGREAEAALRAFLETYGMRCAGEIDITRSRWIEHPEALIPSILNNIRNLAPGAGKQKFEQGLQEARQKEQDLLRRLASLPEGAQKVTETRKMIQLVRTLIGYREYPKYDLVSRYFVYRQALLQEADRLVQAGVLREKEDLYYLRIDELREVVHTHWGDESLIRKRRDDYRRYEKLAPPRVLTSDGEIIRGQYRREHLPAGALAGLAVSSGIVEGRARVLLSMDHALLEEGDILVTTFTDPSWTPLFVSIKGLVTEVGGLMTHGAVVAREYGLPAVVGVEQATRRIKDGQRIRVNGTEGYIELL